jgi:N-acetylglucosamine kinase-like BadF-type ATPase
MVHCCFSTEFGQYSFNMEQAKYVIGIDGGGTKTTALACDPEGSIRAEAHGGASNALIAGFEAGAKTILDLVEECRHALDCEIFEIASIVAGLAGMGREADRLHMESVIKKSAVARGWSLNGVSIETDARIALEGAFGGKPGIVIIAGTGSIVISKDSHGTMHCAGGWGRIIGDDGSGYAIGREALRAAARALDGTGPKTILTKLLAENLNLISRDSIVDAVYKNKLDIASLAPLVMAAAGKSDTTADDILCSQANALAEGVGVLLKHSRSKQVPLAFIGGLLSNNSLYFQKIQSLLHKRYPKIRFQEPEQGPALGAVSLAIRNMRSDKE